MADAECGQIQALISGSKAPVLALAAQSQGTVLAQISEGLLQQREAGKPIRILHLIAYGRPGVNCRRCIVILLIACCWPRPRPMVCC